MPKSISCGKTFRNHTALHTIDEVHHWLQELGKELEERVAEDRKANARLPQLLTVSFYTPPEGQGAAPGQGKVQPSVGPGQGKWVQEGWQGGTSISRSCQLRKATASCMGHDATSLVSLRSPVTLVNQLHAFNTSVLGCQEEKKGMDINASLETCNMAVSDASDDCSPLAVPALGAC